MNDPNGLVEVDGIFHLFYQHNPSAPVWGNIHWGHASSADLIRWDHHPIALFPDEVGEPFSGTIVVDRSNSAGLGDNALVAIYTQDLDGRQRQSLAYSLDGGETWTPHGGNPVLDAPEGIHNFRDPKVQRFSGGGTSWWVMVLAVESEVWLYRSDDLHHWDHTSVLEVPAPWPPSIVEVPELIPVPIEGTDELVWTLIVSLIPPGRERRVAGRVRWVPVDFDGTTITPCRQADHAAALDGGRDLYAMMAWVSDRRDAPIGIGWMDERVLDPGAAVAPWCGRQSLPRRLSFVLDGDRLRLRQQPVAGDFDPLNGASVPEAGGDSAVTLDEPCFAVDLVVRFRADDDQVRLVLAPARGSSTVVVVDRAGLRLGDDGDRVSGREPQAGDPVIRNVLAIVDAGSIEVFVDGGLGAVSELCAVGLGPTSIRVERRGSSEVMSTRVSVPSSTVRGEEW